MNPQPVQMPVMQPQVQPQVPDMQQQAQSVQQPQQAAATAGQPARPPIQEIIVPGEDWQAYMDFIKNKYPFMHVQASQISDIQAAQHVADGKALQVTKRNLTDHAAAFDTKDMLHAITVPEGTVPQLVEGLAKQLGEFASNHAMTKEENKMENNAQAQAVQAQQMGMFEQMKAQAENISWGRVAKGVGLVGGGVVIGKLAFGKGNPEAAEALMSAAETIGKADPKAIANALGTIGKGVVSKLFSI